MLVSAQERNLRVQIPLAQRSLKAPAARAHADSGRAKIPKGGRFAAAAASSGGFGRGFRETSRNHDVQVRERSPALVEP